MALNSPKIARILVVVKYLILNQILLPKINSLIKDVCRSDSNAF